MKTKKLFFVFVLVLITNFGILCAQEGPVRMMAPPSGESKIITPSGITTFPFELVSNHIVVPVEINGTVVRLILDTGMPMEGLILTRNQTTEKLNLPIMSKGKIMSAANGAAVRSDLAMGVDFKLPGVEFSSQMVLVMPDNPLGEVDGVIGESIFKHFATSINYDSMEIALTESDKFNYTGKGEKIPLEIGTHTPPTTTGEVEMKNGEMVSMNMTVDTGCHFALGFNTSQGGSDFLPEKCIEALGVGTGGEFPTKVGRTKGFRIGDYYFTNVLSSFSQNIRNPNKNGGVLGYEILKRFNVIFDYAHNYMILEPNAKFNEPFEFENMAGFLSERTEEGMLEITHIYPDSPAAEAGLKIGDILESINGKPVAGLTRDETTSLLVQEGKEVRLEIKRGGESFSKQIVLRRFI